MDRQNNWWIQFSLIYVFYLINCKGQINIQPADVPWENSPWTLECSLSSIVSTVSFTNPSGTIVGFCEPTGLFPSSCTPNAGYTFTINETSNTVSMTRTITNSETGNWTCKHGADNDQYILSSPLPSRNFPDSSTSFVSHSMSVTAGSKLISGTEHNFTFHYGCLSTNLKFVWTTVPGSSSEDTLNTISNGLTCTTNTAYMSTLDSTAAILQSISSKGTTLSVSVFVNGYYNLPALVEYTFDVTFSPGAASNPSKNCGLHPLWCVLGSILGSLIYIPMYHMFIQRKLWKQVLPALVIVSVVCLIIAAVICYKYCFENGWYGVLLFFVISLLAALMCIGIIHNCVKPKGYTNKPNNTLTPGYTNKPNNTLTPDNTNTSNKTPTPVPPEKVMLLVKSVDTGIISAFEWISEIGKISKDRDTGRLKYSYGSAPLKVSLVINSLSKEDSGIYQCVRTLPREEKDKINVVLNVSYACPIWLVVNPFVWEDQSFEDLSPVDLKKIVTKFERLSLDEVIETLNSHDGRKESSVNWEFSSKPMEEGQIKKINGSTILSAADSGEYRCTLHLKKKTYVFIFYIHYLDGKDSRSQTNEHVFGVPSMLNSNREKSKTGRKQKTRDTGTSQGIHEESIAEQVTVFQHPHHTISKQTQQHDTP